MSAPQKRYNIARFLVTDDSGNATGVSLTIVLEQPYTRKFGMKPDNVTALMPYTEAEKLRAGGSTGPINFKVRGALELWGVNDPQNITGLGPDVSFEKMRIIGAEIVDRGMTVGDTATRIIVWRLVISDQRNDWIEPYGGRLRHGLLNISAKKPTTTSAPPAARTLIKNSTLIQMCLDAMGVVSQINGAGTIDATKPVMDLNWTNSHAATELGKLLEATQSTVVIAIDGAVQIYPIGSGIGPEVPPSRLIASTEIKADVRPPAIVFTSAPTARKITYTLDGPQPGSFEYVVPDNIDINNAKSKKAWYTIDFWPRRSVLGVPSDIINGHFKNAGQFVSELYYNIKLSEEIGDPVHVPILNKVYYQDGTTGDITITAEKIAAVTDTGFKNETKLPIKVHKIVPGEASQGNILILDRRLGKLKNDTSVDSDADFQEVGTFTVNFTVEHKIKQDNGTWMPQFYTLGFVSSGDGGAPTMVLDDDAEELLKEGKAVLVSMPHWQIVATSTGGSLTEPDTSDFVAEAAARATKYFAQVKKSTFITIAEGFFAFDLNGFIGEAVYDVGRGTATFKGNTFFLPTTGLVKPKSGVDGAASTEVTQQAARLADSVAGATTPAGMLNPRTLVNSPSASLLVRIDSATDGGYVGVVMTGRP